MSLHPRRRGLTFTIAAAAWLTAVWVLLWGDLTVANVIAGLLVALAVGWTLRMPSVELTGRVHPLSLLYLVVRFLSDLVVASAQVVAQALTPGRMPRGAVIAVRMRIESDLYLTLTALMTSLVPGSIVVEARRSTGTLYVHILDVEVAGGLASARRHVEANEERILRALASREELTRAGLVGRGREPAGERR